MFRKGFVLALTIMAWVGSVRERGVQAGGSLEAVRCSALLFGRVFAPSE